MKVRELLYTLTTVAHPDHPDRLADGVLVYYKDDKGKPIDIGIIEHRDPVIFSVRSDAPVLGITVVDMARILKLMMHIDNVIAQLKIAAIKRTRENLGGGHRSN